MNVWKDNQATNEALQPYMDLQLVTIMTAHGDAQGQAGYVATLSNYRTATPAMVEDAIRMLQRTASAEYKEIVREFHEMYLSWLVNADRLGESTTLARYF